MPTVHFPLLPNSQSSLFSAGGIITAHSVAEFKSSRKAAGTINSGKPQKFTEMKNVNVPSKP